MKKTLALVLAAALLAGCTARTEHGECIGVFDDKDPKLVYKLSAWNLVMGLLFVELLVPPVVVLVDQTFCPIGKKP